jgi:hypothetical protein
VPVTERHHEPRTTRRRRAVGGPQLCRARVGEVGGMGVAVTALFGKVHVELRGWRRHVELRFDELRWRG